MIKRIQYNSIRFLFWTLLLVAVSVTGLRYMLVELNSFKSDIESQLSQQLGAQVNITKIRSGLNVFRPKVALYGITIQSFHNKEATLQLKEVHLELDLLVTLNKPLLDALQISIMGAKLSVKRLKSGVIAIQGLPNKENTQNPAWLMQGRHYQLIDSDINWHDEKRHADPIQLKHVNISIHNSNQQHKIFIAMDLPETLGHSLNLAMDFSGDMFVPDSIDARLFVQGKNIQLAKIITGDLPFDFTIKNGQGDFSLWSTWHATQMTQLQGSIQVNNAEIQDNHDHRFPLDQLDLQFELQKRQQQWHLGIQNSSLSSQQIDLEIAQLSIALEQNKDDQLIQVALNCPQLDIGQLNKILTRHHALPEKLHQHLQNLTLEGQVQNLLLFANPLEKTFAISGQLKQIHTRATDSFPGLSGLSLYINGTEQHGHIQLNSQKLTFNAPRLFREPLHITYLLGKLFWQQQDKSWVLSSPMLELNTTELKTKNRLQLTLPKSEQPTNLTLQSNFYGYDATQIPHYLTTDIVRQKSLVNWLDHAFLAGDAEQGGLIFRGALNDYPFTQSEGVIELMFNAKNVDLHYADNWHLVEDLDAEIRFFSDNIDINIHHGLANQATIQQASIKINPSRKRDNVSIKGSVKGDLTQAIDFLKQTSYKEQITTLSDLVDMQGQFSAHLDLDISLIDLPARININANPQNAQVYINVVHLPMTEINGTLHITEKGIVSEDLTASALGYPVTAEISSNKQDTTIQLSGLTDIPQLNRQFPSEIWSYLTGESHYQVHLKAPRDITKNAQLQLISDLEGIAIDFPPMSKSAGQAHLFSLDLSIAPLGIDAIKVNYKDYLLSENSLDVNLKKILPHWQGLVHSPFANGSIFIPVDFNKHKEISLFCDTLNLSAVASLDLKTESYSRAIQDIPDIHLESDALYWKNYNIGALKLITQSSADKLLIKQLTITSTRDQLDVSGYWQQSQSSSMSTIKGSLLSLNFGHSLQQLELSENLINSTAEFQFSFNWPGSPLSLTAETLSGDLQAYLANGRFLGVDPGLGRILGALDTQKLFKRLLFDFSDITEKGLSFSEITADVHISQGLVETNNFNINAMPAKIDITGKTHLQTKEVDLLATVLPKFPFTGTMMGSVANTVTKTVVGNQHAGGLILSLLYEIAGTWEHPEVNRLFSPALIIPAIPPRKNNNSATSSSKSK